MPSTQTLTRTYRHENLSGLSGSEAIEVESVDILDQSISASTEEEVTVSFRDTQLQAMSLLSTQAVAAMFLGVRYPITQTVAGPPGTITVADLRNFIFPGDIIRLENMPAAGDDQLYLVATVAAALITLTNGQEIPTAAGGAIGTVARVCSAQVQGYAYTAITVTAATGAITFTGDISDKFAAGDFIAINNSTGNDGIWLISSVAFATPTTTIIVEDTTGANVLPDNTDDGVFHKVSPSIQLAANVPFMWSWNSGIQTPLTHPNTLNATDVIAPTFDADRGDVDALMIDNTGNAVVAEFSGRIAKNSLLIP